MLQRAQWLSRAELDARQWARLRRIVAHAYTRSRHYRRVFDGLGVTPEDIRTPRDFARLPLLRKADLRRPDELLATGFVRDELPSSFTSGSTGEGARTYFDREGWLLGKYLIKLRARLASGVRPWDRVAQFQWIPNRDTWLRRHVLRQKAFGVDRAFADVVEEVRRFRPSVIYGAPGYLKRLGLASEHGLDARLVFTSGEMLTHETRASITRSFRARVLDVYGCTEMKEIAWECPARTGYHINADWLYVEILEKPESGAPEGSIVVTSLYNRAMPLLRYLVGDAGRFCEGSCACGRTLPLMAPEVGRRMDYVRLPDGRDVSPYTAMTPVEAFPGVAQFEILQETIQCVRVRIVPSAEWTGDSAKALEAAVSAVLPGLRVDVEIAEEIAPARGGKYRIVQSTVDRAPDA